jgi:DNA invertase Pin-like site-specific DNA recombinase
MKTLEKIITPRVQPYIRVSSEKQETYSPKAQDDKATEWCQKHGYIKLESIIETGSGESIENRPGIQHALEMGREKLYEYLFVIETSRVARKMADAIHIIDLFRKLGIKVACPYKTYDYSDYNDSFLAHITSTIDELERQRIRERSERGRREAIQSGNYIGEVLGYGWTTTSYEYQGRKVSKIILDEKEKEGLLEIVKMAEHGMSQREIAEEMPRLGYLTKNGKKEWDKATIGGILKSTWLYGEAVYFKKTSFREHGERIYIPQPEESWIHLKVPAVISKDRYDNIQRMTKKRTLNSKAQTAYEYLFADKLTCGNCLEEKTKRGQAKRSARIGHRTDFYIHTLKNGVQRHEAKYPYYICVGRARHLRDWKCTLQQIRATTLDERIWEETKYILKNPTLIYDSVIYSKRETIERKRNQEEKIGKKSIEIEKKKQERQNTLKNYLKLEVVDENTFKAALQEIDAQIKSLETEIEHIKSEKISDPKESVSKESIERVCKELSDSIDKYDFSMKRKIVDALYEDIIVDLDWIITLQGRIPLQKEGIEILHNKFFPSTQHLAGLGIQEHQALGKKNLPDSTQHVAFASHHNSHLLGESNALQYAYFSIKTKLFKDSYYWDKDKVPASSVAKLLGISVKTLKNRENRGFYQKPSRHPHSYYRYYSTEEIEILKKINVENKELIKNRKHLRKE